MKKKNQTQVLYLTQHILEEYWQNNMLPLKEHLHKNILWIGSMDEEYLQGADAMLQRLEENCSVMPPVFLDQQEYVIVQNGGNSCVVAGRYRAFTKPDSGMVLSEKQRVTFVWEKLKIDGKDELQIKHLHLSNTLHIQSEDERFPTKAGRENFEYVQRILAERSEDRVISIKDGNGINHIINLSDIMYFKADGNYVQVFLRDEPGPVRIRATLSRFMEKMPKGFVKVSRSLGINRSYVKSVYKRKLIMIDDAEFQIPATACAEVKKAINRKES